MAHWSSSGLPNLHTAPLETKKHLMVEGKLTVLHQLLQFVLSEGQPVPEGGDGVLVNMGGVCASVVGAC